MPTYNSTSTMQTSQLQLDNVHSFYQLVEIHRYTPPSLSMNDCCKTLL